VVSVPAQRSPDAASLAGVVQPQITEEQLERTDRHVRGFAAASNPSISGDEAHAAYEAADDEWSSNVVLVERVLTDRQAALRAIGRPEAAEDQRPVVLYRITGDFVLRGMSQPKGSPEVTGRFAYVAVDPTTGEGVDMGMGNAELRIEDAGPVTVVFPR